MPPIPMRFEDAGFRHRVEHRINGLREMHEALQETEPGASHEQDLLRAMQSAALDLVRNLEGRIKRGPREGVSIVEVTPPVPGA